MSAEVGEPPGGLRRAAAAGVRWTSASAGIRGVLGLVQVVILTKLLDATDFGLAATATVVLGLVGLFADLGLNNALIARQTRDRNVLSSLYWANVGMATLLGFVAVAAAPLIVLAFGQDELRGLVTLAGLGFVIAALGQQFQLLLQRELRFEVIAKIEVVAQLFTFAVSVACAAAGLGAYAIVIGMLAGGLAKAVLLATRGAVFGRPALHFARRDLDGYLSFGAYQLGERMLGYLAANVDYLLIGLFLGPKALGLYFVAYQLVVKPLLLLNPPLTRVAFPVFAKRGKDDAALRRGFLEVTRLVAFVVGPLLAGIAVTAGHLVPVVFGEQYVGSIVLIQILATIGLTKALSHPIGSVLLAKDRPDLGFKIGVVNLVVLTLALLIGVQFGVEGVAVAYLAIGLAINVAWPFVLERTLGLSPADYLRSLARPLRCAAGAALAMLVLLFALGGQDAEPHAWRLVVIGLAGAFTHLGLVALLERTYVREVVGLLRGR